MQVNSLTYYFNAYPAKMSFADRLRLARKEAGLGQSALATASGVKQSVISDLERGEQLETTRVVEMAIATGVNPIWLATGRGARKYDEIEIVQIWHDLDTERQNRLLATARDLRSAQYGNKPSAKNPFPHLAPPGKKTLGA